MNTHLESISATVSPFTRCKLLALGLYEGSVNRDDVVSVHQLFSFNLANLPIFLLERAGISITAETGATPTLDDRLVDAFAQMLMDTKLRVSCVDFIISNLHEDEGRVLSTLALRLSERHAESYMHLITFNPRHSRNVRPAGFQQNVRRYLIDVVTALPSQREIINKAVSARCLSRLYAATGWDLCLEARATPKQHRDMLSHALGLN